MTEIENLRAELWRLRALAAKVCWFDWSENDPDAVAAIDDLRKAVLMKPPKKVTSWRVCPRCRSRATKLFHISGEGSLECQICDHKYDPPKTKG